MSSAYGSNYDPNWCSRCEQAIAPGQKVCECGKATSHMSFAERSKYEVAQWRAYKARAAS